MTKDRIAGRAAMAAAGFAALAALLPGRPGPVAPGRVAVEVRVFDGGRFVPDLKLADFAIDDAGLTTAPSSLYLMRKGAIERKEGEDFWPDLSRKIHVLFQMTEYHSKIPEALAFLFDEEIGPGDTLRIQTPVRNYALTPEALAARPKAVLAGELGDIVRKDILQGGMAYNSILRELRRIVQQISGGGRTGFGDIEGEVDDGMSLENRLTQYKITLQKMETLRAVDEARLISYAREFKGAGGRPVVIYIYQREFRPELSSQTIDNLVTGNQDKPTVLADVQELFQMYQRNINLEPRRIREAFADSGVTLYFLYMNRAPDRISGISMREQSEDVFKALTAAVEASGGAVLSNQNPAASLREAFAAADRSYLLFFIPSTAAPEGTFLDLKVSVKGRDYKILHRSGYFAR